VRTFSADGQTMFANFFAYSAGFGGGVTWPQVTFARRPPRDRHGAGAGRRPHVRVFNIDGSDTGVSFFPL